MQANFWDIVTASQLPAVEVTEADLIELDPEDVLALALELTTSQEGE